MRSYLLVASCFAIGSSLAGCTQEIAGAGSTDTASEAHELTTTTSQALTAPTANTIFVDRSTDSTDGLCRVGTRSGGNCNLRAAVAAASLNSSAKAIELDVESYLSLGEIAVAPTGARPEFTISVVGPGGAVRATINRTAGVSRLFNVAANATLSLADVVISNFTVSDYSGGGAILNAGTVQTTRTTFSANSVTCQSTGAMTAFATCGGGAINNTGTLGIGADTRFDSNYAAATAQTAATTDASTYAGAIVTSGSVTMTGPVTFYNNSATATAQSGYHPSIPGSAYADSTGGAVYVSGGTFTVSGAAGSCIFSHNTAKATAYAPATPTTPTPTMTASSRGVSV